MEDTHTNSWLPISVAANGVVDRLRPGRDEGNLIRFGQMRVGHAGTSELDRPWTDKELARQSFVGDFR
jgi:hypothetical protein